MKIVRNILLQICIFCFLIRQNRLIRDILWSKQYRYLNNEADSILPSLVFSICNQDKVHDAWNSLYPPRGSLQSAKLDGRIRLDAGRWALMESSQLVKRRSEREGGGGERKKEK